MIWNGYTPATLFPVVGIVAVIRGILYLLRVRRRSVEVPYLGIWKSVHSKRRKWVDHLKRVLSFLVWVLIVCLVALALMDPRVEEDDTACRHAVLVIDTSASMGALMEGADCGTRLACALKEAHEAVDRMTVADRMTIVEGAGNVHASGPFTSDKEALHAVLDKLKPRAASAQLGQAMQLASQLTHQRENAEIVLFSDGQFSKGDIDESKIPVSVALTQKNYGTAAENLAIESFNVRRYISNRLGFEVFLSVHNGFKVPVTAKIEIYNLGEGERTLGSNATVIAEKKLTLASGASEVRIYDNLTLSSSRMAAKIVLEDPADAKDVLPEDDVAYARVPDFARPDILVLTPGNLFLEAALLLNENYRVKIEKPKNHLTNGKLDLAQLASKHDIVILDNSYHDLPELENVDADGRFFFINPRQGEAPFSESAVKDPVVERVNSKHAVSRWLSLKNLNIGDANVFKNVKRDDVILRAIEGPLIVTQKTDSRRALFVGFSLVESDLIFRVALPVLIINAVDWFMDEGGEPVLAYETGDAWHVRVPSGMNVATLTTPSGDTRRSIPAYEQIMTVYGDEAGIYQLRDENNPARTYEFAANFANAEESELSREPYMLPTELHASASILEDNPEAEPDALLEILSKLPSSAQNIWVLALLLVTLGLFAEWLTYHRRWSV